jgi:hypothetical protein
MECLSVSGGWSASNGMYPMGGDSGSGATVQSMSGKPNQRVSAGAGFMTQCFSAKVILVADILRMR